jgi:hypothetical protein
MRARARRRRPPRDVDREVLGRRGAPPYLSWGERLRPNEARRLRHGRSRSQATAMVAVPIAQRSRGDHGVSGIRRDLAAQSSRRGPRWLTFASSSGSVNSSWGSSSRREPGRAGLDPARRPPELPRRDTRVVRAGQPGATNARLSHDAAPAATNPYAPTAFSRHRSAHSTLACRPTDEGTL